MALKQDHLGFSWIIYLSSGGAKDYILYRSFKKAHFNKLRFNPDIMIRWNEIFST